MIPYGNKRAKLTEADKETVLVMHFNGELPKAIALKVHCSESNVYALTRRFRPISKRKLHRRSYRTTA